MRKPLFLLSGFLTVLFFLSAHAQEKENLPFRHYTVSDGLSNNIVYCILQDHSGLIWLGTEDGLNTFDGYQFYQFKCNPADSLSLSNNIIRCIYEDKDHFIWVGTDDGLNVFNPVTGKFTRYKNKVGDSSSISRNFISCISEDASGNMWIGTSGGGLNEFNRKTNRFNHFNPDTSLRNSFVNGFYITAILADSKTNKIWLGIQGNLMQFDPELSKFIPLYMKETIYPATTSGLLDVTSFYRDRSGTLWVGTLNDGLNELNEQTEKFIRYKNNSSDANSISQNSVFSICEDSKGQLWIATLGGGLNVFNKEGHKFSVFSTDEKNETSLSSNLAWSVLIDKAGTVWVGTSTGLNTYDKNRLKFSTLQVEQGKNANNNVLSIYKDHENNLWVGVLGGGLYEYDSYTKKVIASYKPNGLNSLSNINVFCLYEDHQGTLWVGTFNGLNALDKKTAKFKRYLLDSSFIHGSDITSIYEDDKNNLWVGTLSGGLGILDRVTEKFSYYNSIDKSHYLDNDNISCIFQGSDKTIWVGTFGGGLDKYNTSTKTFTSFKNNPEDNKSISSDYIYCINEDKKGVLWIGTYGAGLNSISNNNTGTFIRYNKAGGLTNNVIDGILTDNDNHLWLSTNNGIVELANDGGNTSILRSYDERDGLQYKYNPRSCFKSADGELYFGGVNGFNVFNPKEIVNNPNQPPVIITRFKVFDKDFPLDTAISQKKKIVLSSSQKFFSFEFAGLNYAFPEKNKYAYKLEGFDKDWVESGSRRYAAYTNLDQGTYTFRVKASNNDGVWNDDGASIKVIINPPFWKTWWFYLIDAFVFGLAIVTFIQLRTRTLRIQNKEMERKVSLRTHELQVEKEKTEQKSTELEKTLKHLESTQDQLIQSEKLASLGALTAGIAHEIQNPLNFVNNYSEVSKELLEEAAEEKDSEKKNEILKDLSGNLEKIFQHGKRADRIVKAMLMHSRAEAGEKELVDINTLCEEAVNLSLPGVRANIPDFRCEVEKHYEQSNPRPKIIRQDISRVILNLLNNAFFAVDEKSKKINQKASGIEYMPKVVITTSTYNHYVLISIRDNGDGIPALIKEKIFQPFFTTKPSGVGTGLGLSISYDIVKSHGGEIKLNSKEGAFTEFIISLPL